MQAIITKEQTPAIAMPILIEAKCESETPVNKAAHINNPMIDSDNLSFSFGDGYHNNIRELSVRVRAVKT